MEILFVLINILNIYLIYRLIKEIIRYLDLKKDHYTQDDVDRIKAHLKQWEHEEEVDKLLFSPECPISNFKIAKSEDSKMISLQFSRDPNDENVGEKINYHQSAEEKENFNKMMVYELIFRKSKRFERNLSFFEEEMEKLMHCIEIGYRSEAFYECAELMDIIKDKIAANLEDLKEEVDGLKSGKPRQLKEWPDLTSFLK